MTLGSSIVKILGDSARAQPNTSSDRRADSAFFNLFFGFQVVDNRRARSTLTIGREARLINAHRADTPSGRLLIRTRYAAKSRREPLKT
jgi:hypothetical protein